MHLITGSSTSNHVTSANDGIRNAHIFGKGSFVLKGFGDFTATKINDNTVRVGIGQGIINGRMFEITSAEDVAIANGTTGKKRIDLIVARYTKNTSTGIESIALAVIKGGATTGTPSEPPFSHNNILDGVTTAEMPLYRVLIDGLSISTITAVFEYKENISENLEGTKDVTLEGSYNLIPFPYYESSKTASGITFTVNDDGSVSVSGTATANTYIVLCNNLPIESGKKYAIVNHGYTDDAQAFLQIYQSDWSLWHAVYRDNPFVAQNKTYWARIYIANGKTINATFHPLLVEVAEDGSYPTDFVRNNIKSNRELTDFDSKLKDALFFKGGETWKPSGSIACVGFMTNSLRNIYFSVPLPKMLTNISSISLTKFTSGIRQSLGSSAGNNNGYINTPSGDNNWLTTSGITVEAKKGSDNVLTIIIKLASGYFGGSPGSQNVLVVAEINSSNFEVSFTESATSTLSLDEE